MTGTKVRDSDDALVCDITTLFPPSNAQCIYLERGTQDCEQHIGHVLDGLNPAVRPYASTTGLHPLSFFHTTHTMAL